jgi:hypothetical protein
MSSKYLGGIGSKNGRFLRCNALSPKRYALRPRANPQHPASLILAVSAKP